MGRSLYRAYFPLTTSGAEHVPDGPFVVAANHFSHLDPPAVGFAVNRTVRFLAVDELFGNSRLFDNLIIWVGVIPTSRTRAPLGALRLAIAELESGGSVGLFPEGVRVWRWGEEQPKRGAAWLARRAGVPLLPVAISGSDEALGRGTTRVSRQPMHTEICVPVLPGDFDDAKDPIGAMMAQWADRIGDALTRRYEG